MHNQTCFQGNPVELAGNFITPGTTAPDFRLVKADLGDFSLKDGGGKNLLLNIFPSLDTSVCSIALHRFNALAAGMENTILLGISKDLPFAQSRFCAAEGIKNAVMLSDVRHDSNFGRDYGVLMTGGPLDGLLARAVVIVNASGRVVYSDLNAEITTEPDYERALAALATL